MRDAEKQSAFYDILSDISLAMVGVFVLLFVVLVLLSNRDVLADVRARNKAQAERDRLVVMIESERKRASAIIEKRTAMMEQKVRDMEADLEHLRDRGERIKRALDDLGKAVRGPQELATITEAEVRELLEESRLRRERIDAALADVRLKRNHVRQEFNIYKEKLGEWPYLEFRTKRARDAEGVVRNWIMLRSQGRDHGVWKEDFRVTVLRKVNAGSGFCFRYVGKQPCPEWVDEMLKDEGWPPAIEGGM